MTWVPSRRRWTAMHKGQRFWVSCKALGVPETKEDSYQAANAWWIAKRAEIDAASRPPARQPQPLDDLAAAYLDKTPEVFADGRALVLALMDRLGMLGTPRPLS